MSIKWTASLGIILGLWTFASGKVCPDMKVLTYSIYKMNASTGRLVTETKFKERTSFVCCKGYREIGRILGRLQPKCDPVCEPVCGNGTCYAPNRCSCESGYTHSAAGSCVPDIVSNIAKHSPYQVDLAQKIYSRDVGQSNEPTGPIFASYTIPTLTTKQTNQRTVNFVPPFTTKRTVNLEQPKDQYAPPFTTKQPITTTVKFAQPTESYLPATTSRSGSEKCGRCDRGTCVDGICMCALGYKPTQGGSCHPVCSQSCLNGHCVEPNRCACIEGYSYDSESLQCKPLCNGKIYGCIRGTCVGYNQCRCDNGTVLQKDELFYCIDRDGGQLISASPWCLLLLVVPVVAVGASLCVVFSRWKTAKVNRVQVQEESFSEVRFHNAGNEHSSIEGYQKACSKEKYLKDDPNISDGTIRRNGNMLIINT